MRQTKHTISTTLLSASKPLKSVKYLFGCIVVHLLAVLASSGLHLKIAQALPCQDGSRESCICRDGSMGTQQCVTGAYASCVCTAIDKIRGDCFGKWTLKDSKGERHSFMIFEKSKGKYEIRQGAVPQGGVTYNIEAIDTASGQCKINVAVDERPICCGGPDPEDLPKTKTELSLVEFGGQISGIYTTTRNYSIVDKRTVTGNKSSITPTDTQPTVGDLVRDMNALTRLIPDKCDYAEKILPRYRGKLVNVTIIIAADGGPQQILINGQDIKIDDCVATISENRIGIFPNYSGKPIRVSFPYQMKMK